MRIIGGKYRGRVLPVPKGFKARPTTDFARENLFNIIENSFDLTTIAVLDLFAGTGGISYEFASRGTPSIDVVEIELHNFNHIRKTAIALDFTQIHVIRNDVFKFLGFCHKTYDLIFADPPYSCAKIPQIATMVINNRLLNQNGCLIIEHSAANSFAETAGFFRHKSYGSVNFSFFNAIP
ncbi:MAG: RsmD family RNA methyltransferase [Prevotellaceae bacterium]|jgi:16S rRNA (guanine(966)-N(2))-methyltransferase RsmD|nr:RsmD family RNA methyltransferase [Prevotellaceae bacterium]